jgi:molecular chaperone GrpE
MSKSDPRVKRPAEEADDARPEAEVSANVPAGGAAEGAAPPEEDELSALRREVAELKDKQLRLVAESQNCQKRAQREKQEAIRFAEFDFCHDLLVILDDLERTLLSADKGADVRAVADGVRIVYEHFLKVLASHGVRPIEALGRSFDPTYHEAIMQQPSAELPAGKVAQEVSRGYTMHERVLRPSRVVVSGGPGAAADADTPPPDPAADQE